MPKVGRTSLEALLVTENGLAATIPRPEPPFDLDDREAAIWQQIVNSMPATHFIPANYPLLAQLCRHITEARRAAHMIKMYRKSKVYSNRTYGELLRQQRNETLAIVRLSTSMRLSHQSTVNQHKRIHHPPMINNATGKPEVEW